MASEGPSEETDFSDAWAGALGPWARCLERGQKAKDALGGAVCSLPSQEWIHVIFHKHLNTNRADFPEIQ